MEQLFEIFETAFIVLTVLWGSLAVGHVICLWRLQEDSPPEYTAKFWIAADIAAGVTFSWIYDSSIPATIAALLAGAVGAVKLARQ